MKKTLSLFLSIVMLFSITAGIDLSAYAATTAFNQISSSKVMKTHTITTGNTVCYTSSTLKTRGTTTAASKTAYIAGSDDLYVYKVGKNSNGTYYAYVSYPVNNKRYNAYIPLSAITKNNGSHKKTTATGKVYTYLRSNGTGGNKNTLYISKGETVYLVATTSNYYQVMYPVSGGWRLAWITKSNYNKYCSVSHTHSYTTGYEAVHPHRVYKKCSCGYYYYTGETKKVSSCTTCYPNKTTVSKKFQYPMVNYHKNYTQWGIYPSYRKSSTRKYHVGVDFMSNSNSNIYSVASGTVKKTGYNSANGNYVIIQHTISSKTVYSFYAHLKSINTKSGAKVSAGTKIGVVGATGSGANGTTHLHFAIVDSYWSSGGYYGYISKKFSSNKVYDSESKVTYYNPYYVIANGKLPS